MAKSYTRRKFRGTSMSLAGLFAQVSIFFPALPDKHFSSSINLVCPPAMTEEAFLSPAVQIISTYNFSLMPSFCLIEIRFSAINLFPSSSVLGVKSLSTSS